MGVRIQELPETTGIKKEDVLIVEDGQGTKKGTVQQLDEALGVSQLKEDLVNLISIEIINEENYVFIDKNGFKTTSKSNYAYSKPIKVSKDFVYYFKGLGTELISAISECDSQGRDITPVSIYQSMDMENIVYTPNKDGYIILSWNDNNPHSLYLGGMYKLIDKFSDYDLIIENGTCKNLIGNEYNKLYYAHIPKGVPWTISKSDGLPVESRSVKICIYNEDGSYIDYWTLKVGTASRTIIDNDNNIFWFALDKEYMPNVPIQIEIGSVATDYVEHCDNFRTLERIASIEREKEKENASTIYTNELDDTVSKYETILNASGKPILTFALYTDLHHDTKYETVPTKDMFANMKELYNRVPFEGLYNLGDLIDGQFSTKAKAEGFISYVNGLSKDVTPYRYSIVGNHDNNRQSTWEGHGGLDASNQLTDLEMYSILNKNNKDVVRNANRPLDYYIDYEEYGIRIICISIDNAYVRYALETKTWLENIALNTDKQIIVLSHCATKSKWGYKNDITNGDFVETPLKTFVENGGTIIAFIHGHTHGDLIETDTDISWTEVSVGCGLFEQITDTDGFPNGMFFPSRNANDYTKILFDLICVDQTNRKIHFIRYGAGQDYVVTY